MQSARDIITAAMSRSQPVHIRYRDYQGRITERDVTPLEWEPPADKFRAYCHLRNAERHFLMANVLDCSHVSPDTQQPLRPPSEARSQDDKWKRWRELDNKSGYDRTPADAAEYLQLSRELIGTLQPRQGGAGLMSRTEPAPSPSPSTANRPVFVPAQEVRPRPAPVAPTDQAARPFNHVQNANEWNRLVNYYVECLVRENRQQYIIENVRLSTYFFASSENETCHFLEANGWFEFPSGSSSAPSPLAKFVRAGRTRGDQQLCLGFPLLVLEPDKVAPLMVAPLLFETADAKIRFKIEDGYEPSYAVFDYLHCSDEEKVAILSGWESLEAGDGQLLSTVREQYLVGSLSDIYRRPIQRTTWNGSGQPPLPVGTLFAGPCLFWVRPDVATGNLIIELKELALPDRWPGLPSHLRQFLSAAPEHEYPGVESYEHDPAIHVAAANDRQRRAMAAGSSEPLTVITGPPGTGKSQLILNLIAQATLRGETVLFASRNNKAVDVVMSRMLDEVGFLGAVRTGNRDNRKSTPTRMASALEQVRAAGRDETPSALKKQYATLKQQLLATESLLTVVRDLVGRLRSYDSELDDLRRVLPKKVFDLASNHAPPFIREEFDRLQVVLSDQRVVALAQQDSQEALTAKIARFVADNPAGSGALAAVKEVADQWGSFGGRFISSPPLDTLEQLESHIETWLELTNVLERHASVLRLRSTVQDLAQANDDMAARLSAAHLASVGKISASVLAEKLETLEGQAKQLDQRASYYVRRKSQWWLRLLMWSQALNPARRLTGPLAVVHQALGLDWEIPELPQPVDLPRVATLCAETLALIQASLLSTRLAVAREALDVAREQLALESVRLPKELADDIDKVLIEPGLGDALRPEVEALRLQIAERVEQRRELIRRINAKIGDNVDALRMLEAFKATAAGQDRKLWRLKDSSRLSSVVGHLTTWHNMLALWMVNEGQTSVEKQIRELPSEAELLSKVKGLSEALFTLGAKIIRSNWIDRVSGMETEALQQTYRYVTAVQQLNDLSNENYDATQYRQLKTSEAENWAAALAAFPVWATTNLTARTNLPSMPGLFDMVIIDEASQCDVPSALPLLYRAKRVVIVGDPQQLRHVATLHSNFDREAAGKFNIALEAFSYRDLSLFDLAERSIGNRPGTVFLDEHYRSDRRIIGFSNEEFYSRGLVIRTDMRRLGFPDEFLRTSAGVSWLDVRGRVQYPAGGSVSNWEELQAMQKLVPRLLEQLARRGVPGASLGIVTPYREQERLIRNWLLDQYHEGHSLVDMISAGTAHKFQGDEKDVMIFSTVLASDMTPGSLNWLNHTVNLLNVAVTRARVALVIVGDYEFCQQLPVSSKFRRLSDYVVSMAGRVAQTIDDVPLISAEASDVIGVLLDAHDANYNRTTLRKLLVSCRDYVWWMDQYMNSQVFDLLLDVCQHPDADLRDIRILTNRGQVDTVGAKRAELSITRAAAVQSELNRKGIKLQVGVLPKNDLPHDRYLYSRNHRINMPPFSGAYGDHKMISEYTTSLTAPSFFESYWLKAEQLV